MVETGSEMSEEDMQERLKNMTPEELKEFQKKQCIFCQIIANKVPSKKIYSDDVCTAILDINPANPGHILLLPNEHYAIMPLIPEDEIAHMFMVAKALCHAMLKGLKAEGALVFVANGLVAGQKAQHFMIHVIPRKEGDNVSVVIPEKRMRPEDEAEVVKRLKPMLAKAFGAKAAEEEKPEKVQEPKPEEAKPKPEKEEKPKKKEAKPKPAKEEKQKKGKQAKEKKQPAAKKNAEPKASIDDIARLLTGGGM